MFKVAIQKLPAKFSQQLQDALKEIPVIPLKSRFEIVGAIGKGGMGAVFKAIEKGLDRIVAIKRLLINEEQVFYGLMRFLREAKTLAKLNHQNIVNMYQTAYDSEGLFIVMEYIEGVTLSQLMRIRGRLTITECLIIIKAIARALEFAHNLGVIHRDVKPGNVMLTGAGVQKLMSAKKLNETDIKTALKETNIKVLDFGLAKLRETGETPGISHSKNNITEIKRTDSTGSSDFNRINNNEKMSIEQRRTKDKKQASLSSLTKLPVDKELELSVTGSVLGTVMYAAPEQKKDPRNVDKSVDVYSLGLVFYQLLTGIKPTMLIPSKIQLTFRELIMKAVEPDPAQRIPSIQEFITLLEESIIEEEQYLNCMHGSSQNCTDFLKKYPASVFRTRIENLVEEKKEEEKNYQKALNGTMKDCTEYLRLYEKGRYTEHVKELFCAKEKQINKFLELLKIFGIAVSSGVLFSLIFISASFLGFLLGLILGGASGFGIYWYKYKYEKKDSDE